MSKHYTTNQDRRSKIYGKTHAALCQDVLAEIAKQSKSEDLKRERKRMKSTLFFRTAET